MAGSRIYSLGSGTEIVRDDVLTLTPEEGLRAV